MSAQIIEGIRMATRHGWNFGAFPQTCQPGQTRARSTFQLSATRAWNWPIVGSSAILAGIKHNLIGGVISGHKRSEALDSLIALFSFKRFQKLIRTIAYLIL